MFRFEMDVGTSRASSGCGCLAKWRKIAWDRNDVIRAIRTGESSVAPRNVRGRTVTGPAASSWVRHGFRSRSTSGGSRDGQTAPQDTQGQAEQPKDENDALALLKADHAHIRHKLDAVNADANTASGVREVFEA